MQIRQHRWFAQCFLERESPEEEPGIRFVPKHRVNWNQMPFSAAVGTEPVVVNFFGGDDFAVDLGKDLDLPIVVDTPKVFEMASRALLRVERSYEGVELF